MSQHADEPCDDPDDMRADAYDVAVVGGGAAGLSAAVALGRFAQSVVVIDDATPRNAAAGHSPQHAHPRWHTTSRALPARTD